MAQVGDRVATHTSRVGQASRQGEVLEVVGSFLKVRWDDGAETLVTPASVAVLKPPASPAAEAATKAAGMVEKGAGMVGEAAREVKKVAGKRKRR